jgi:hypothetical protein
VRLGYADPPYIGCAHLYVEKREVDHIALVKRLEANFDGWVLHASAANHSEEILAPLMSKAGARKGIWVKQFAAFKRNVSVAYAWEPVYIKALRKPVVSKRLVMRDWIMEPITMKRGLTGVKPEKVCHWAFELAAARPEDELIDLFPGTGAVMRAWAAWQGKFNLPLQQSGSDSRKVRSWLNPSAGR